jgi:hypothetical protein
VRVGGSPRADWPKRPADLFIPGWETRGIPARAAIRDSFEVWPNATVFHVDDLSGLGALPSERELEAAVAHIRQDRSIPFDHIEEGCTAREQLVRSQLRRCGFNAARLGAYANGTLQRGGRVVGDVSLHVATLVFVKDSGFVFPKVVDPSLCDTPMAPEDWLSRYAPLDEETQLTIERASPRGDALRDEQAREELAKLMSGE